MNSTLVTLATYNEIENLPELVSGIFQFAPEVDILVIDDNSPDGTGNWCDQFASTEPRMHCLHRSAKLGLGTATIQGIEYAIAQGYQQVVNMDADFSHHPRHLPSILAGMQQQAGDRFPDVVIGSRYTPGGRIEGWPFRRHLMSRAVNCYARTLLGLSPRDCSGSYRCYRIHALKQLDFSTIRSRGYSFQEEILYQLTRQGAALLEVPITFVDRQRGVSKIDAGEALDALRIIFALGLKRLCGPRNPSPSKAV